MANAIGVAGQQATMTPATFVSETVAADIAAGLPVELSDNNACKPGTGSVGTFIGIHCPAVVGHKALADDNESARLIQQGDVWVTVAAAVSAGDAVGYTSTGTFAKAATSTYPNAITGAYFVHDADKDGVALVRLNGVATTSL